MQDLSQSVFSNEIKNFLFYTKKYFFFGAVIGLILGGVMNMTYPLKRYFYILPTQVVAKTDGDRIFASENNEMLKDFLNRFGRDVSSQLLQNEQTSRGSEDISKNARVDWSIISHGDGAFDIQLESNFPVSTSVNTADYLLSHVNDVIKVSNDNYDRIWSFPEYTMQRLENGAAILEPSDKELLKYYDQIVELERRLSDLLKKQGLHLPDPVASSAILDPIARLEVGIKSSGEILKAAQNKLSTSDFVKLEQQIKEIRYGLLHQTKRIFIYQKSLETMIQNIYRSAYTQLQGYASLMPSLELDKERFDTLLSKEKLTHTSYRSNILALIVLVALGASVGFLIGTLRVVSIDQNLN